MLSAFLVDEKTDDVKKPIGRPRKAKTDDRALYVLLWCRGVLTAERAARAAGVTRMTLHRWRDELIAEGGNVADTLRKLRRPR